MAVSTPFYSHTLQLTYRDEANNATTTATTALGDTKLGQLVNVAAGAAAQETDIVLTASAIKSLLLATSGPALAITPYNGATAGTVINVPTGGAVMWNTYSTGPCPITANATKFLIGNTAATPAAAAVLTIAVLEVLTV